MPVRYEHIIGHPEIKEIKPFIIPMPSNYACNTALEPEGACTLLLGGKLTGTAVISLQGISAKEPTT